jgi:hypothetical protein
MMDCCAESCFLRDEVPPWFQAEAKREFENPSLLFSIYRKRSSVTRFELAHHNI